MGKLIYSMLTSLDGYVSDEQGRFDWAMPSEEVHLFINELMRPMGTHLYGRRMYEVMAAWETLETRGEPRSVAEFAEIWRDAEKIVYSSTLESAPTDRTRVERAFDPARIEEMKRSNPRDLSVSGPGLASHAFRNGLVDECHLFIAPVIVGGGTRSLPEDVRIRLELVDQRRFENGMAYLSYVVGPPEPSPLR